MSDETDELTAFEDAWFAANGGDDAGRIIHDIAELAERVRALGPIVMSDKDALLREALRLLSAAYGTSLMGVDE